jgi:hypothetical protein
MTLATIASQHRVRIRRDECNDEIIPGKRGHLYMDGSSLCAMWIDARPMNLSTLAGLGGKVWQGDISDRVQDAWVKRVAPDKVALALRLVGAKARRRVSDATLARLARINPHTAGKHSPPTGASDLGREGWLYPPPEI